MTPDIVRKLKRELRHGIKTEVQVIYLMAGIRKILEQEGQKPNYPYLTFHCDWALHPTLSGRFAQTVLKYFDEANIAFKDGLDFDDLPDNLRVEIDAVSQWEHLKNEMYAFLNAKGLSNIGLHMKGGWIRFVALYAQVISDTPLIMSSTTSGISIINVTVSIEYATQTEELAGHRLFKTVWTILDKNGHTGTLSRFHTISPERTQPRQWPEPRTPPLPAL